ncbi:M15 family metallopeptidase [uncultured Granulicatella sp.]|uniref:M15 family metallopeptidase n=1 Tax=uncultured Granulicatella sp. TaxID=316089 RepID=UPI002619E8E9|nr:M15 family metallopeptidase [uncultured Granulicatella sp.]
MIRVKKELLSAVALSLVLLGCSQKNNPNETTASQSTSTQTTNITTTDTTTTGKTTVTSTEASSEESSTKEATTEKQQASQGNGMADVTLGYQMVVNKKHALPSTYAPGEDPTARAQVKKLIQKMQELEYPISDVYSGYRSYEYQEQLYNNYVAREGQVAADTYSARPGYSEHQTGLAFDLLDTTGNLLDGEENKDAIDWLHTHAHEYGFIIRFQVGKEAITGYQAEAWHLRYVGNKATDIYNSGLSLEEYYGVPGGDYE